MGYELKPLSEGLGVEITGIALEQLIPDNLDFIYQIWLRHHVVLIRNSPITEEAQICLGKRFGRVEKARKASPLASHPEIMVISNIREGGQELGSLPDGELVWHYDRVHQPIPNKAGILHALQLPSSGGETRFANMCRVYESLPDDLKQVLSGLSALNTYQYGQTRAEDKRLSAETPSSVHPMVRVLPETGAKALFVCRLMTDRIVGVSDEESERILSGLFEYTENTPYIYEHSWQIGDVLIWDNRCVVHARKDFDPGETRLLKRVTVADNVAPIAPEPVKINQSER